MKFVIGANNVKVFAKSILALSKIGDELYIEPLQNSLTIRTVNSSRSAFACFSFKQSFFTLFEPQLTHKNSTNNDQTLLNNTTLNEDSLIEASDSFKCKIPAKCLLAIFKNINSLEKNIEKCTITVKYIPLSQDTSAKIYDYNSTTVTKMIGKNNQEQLFDTKFLVIMNSKHGIRKTFILSISDCENLQAAFSTENCTNKLNISAKYLHETINSFSNDTEEVSFVVEANKLNIKNYVEPDNETKSLINTQVSFDSDEFNSYEIEKEAEITFCLKEFKICLIFGNWFDLGMDIYFQKKGRPIIFKFNGANNNYEANFTQATLADDASTTQNTTIQSHPNISVTNSNSTSQMSSRINQSEMANRNNLNNITNSSNSRLIKTQSTASSNVGTPLVLVNNEKQNKTPLTDRTKASKRPLFDSNQVFLSGSLNQNDPKVNVQNNKQSENSNTLQQPDSDEDDVLLTQALNEHQEILRSQSNPTRKASPPPAKKMRSLTKTLFDDSDNDDDGDHTITKSVNNNKTVGMSIARLLESDDDSEDDSSNGRKKLATSIYIEETDSE